MKDFVESQFSYCSLIWMFHSRRLNNKVDSIHEDALRITFNDKSSTFQELLDKDNSVTIHHRNIRALATEIYKVLHEYSPATLNEIFLPSHCKYNSRKSNSLNSIKSYSLNRVNIFLHWLLCREHLHVSLFGITSIFKFVRKAFICIMSRTGI